MLHLKTVIAKKNLILNHHSGFKNKFSVLNQIDRITNVFKKTAEEKLTFSLVFMDVAQAFNTVWNCELDYKREICQNIITS